MASARDRELEHALLGMRAADECVVIWREPTGQPAEPVAFLTSSAPNETFAPDHGQLPPMAQVRLWHMPLTDDGRIDLDALAALPVLDESLIDRWRQLISASPGVRQVLVTAHSSAEPVPLLHVSDLLPDWHAALTPTPSNAREAAPISADVQPDDAPIVPSLAYGGPLLSADNLPPTLPEALSRAADSPQSDALIHVHREGQLQHSFRDLLTQSQQVLAGLRAAGLEPGDKAILQLSQSDHILPAFWGCVLGGIVPVLAPIPPTFDQPNRVLDQLGHLGSLLEPAAIVTTEPLKPALTTLVQSQWAHGSKILTIDELRQHESDGQHHPCRPDDPALFSLTSGSTGLPKCVVLTHRNLLSRAAGANDLGRHSADDVVLNWLPFDHIASISDWHLRCVLLGCRIVYAPKEYIISQPLVWLDLIDRYRVTHTWAPNFAYALVSDLVANTPSPAWNLSTVAAFLTAGEAVSAATMQRFAQQLAPCGLKPTALRPAFGMAEMASGVTYYLATDDAPLQICRARRSSLSGRIQSAAPDDPDAVSFVSLGPPIPGVNLRIVDAQGNLVGQETVGHLHIQGEPVSSGYYRAPDANSVFRDDGWFETGDLGFLRHGQLYLTGRAKDSIIVNGANYGCGEIEEIVDSVPGVEATFSAACPVRDRRSGHEQWALFFHTARTDDRQLAALLKEIRGHLARQMGIRPDYLIPLAKQSIPKTAIGKLQRSQLSRRFEAGEMDAILKRLDLLEANERTLPDAFYAPVWRGQVRRLKRIPLAETPLADFPIPPGSICLVSGDPTDVAIELIRSLLRRDVNIWLSVRPEAADTAAQAWKPLLAEHPDALAIGHLDLSDPAALRDAIHQAETRWQRSCQSALYVATSLLQPPATVPSPADDLANLARALHDRESATLLALVPADAQSPEPDLGSLRFLCYALATDPALGALGLTPAQLRDSILAGWQRGVPRLVLGLDAAHPAVRHTCDDEPCAAENLVAHVEAPPDWSPESLQSQTLPDRFGTDSRCRIVVVDRLPSPDPDADGRPPDEAPVETEIQRQLRDIWKDVLRLPRVDIHDNLFELGGNSMLLVQLHGRIEAAFGPRLSVVDMFKYPTIASLASVLAAPAEMAAVSAPAARGRHRAEVRQRGRSATHATDVAVIGLACRMPGAPSVAQFWQNLASGVESIARFSEEQVLASGVDPNLVRNPRYVRAAPVLDGIDQFDADFFGHTAREAELMDPQQRVLLECAWEAMEDAGYDLRHDPGAVGVFVSGVLNTYLLNHLYPAGAHLDGDASHVMTLSSTGGFQVMVANDKDYLPLRISYKLNLRGPSVNVQTACSSSLVAIHTASQSLLRGECDMALAGGASICVPQETGYLYQEGLLVSPDGHCRAFDADAQGTVFGSGVGLVLLKRLDDALADGDHIYAVVKGSAVNNDGGQKAGYLAPSQDGQAAVVAEALAAAGVDADSISYVEAHGTGTALGDPIEIAGLSQAFRADTDRVGFCAVGSVKTNVGHLQIASGVAGFLKAVLSLSHAQLAPSLHFQTPNPRIDWDRSPFYVNAQLADWPEGSQPRRASVNALGIGGTNAHIILEEPPHVPRPQPASPQNDHLLVLSAKTPEALRQLADRYHAILGQEPALPWSDVCFTAAVGRAHFAHRLAVLAEDGDDARQKLRTALDGAPAQDVWTGHIEPSEASPSAWPPPELLTTLPPHELLAQAAQRYAEGLPVDWGTLYRPAQYRRVSLPTYPFQRKRHWIPRVRHTAPATVTAAEPTAGLLGQRISSPALRDAVFQSRLGLQSLPILDDHRFYDTPILPGAFQLAMVVEAAARLAVPDSYAIEDVSFAEALAVPDDGDRIVQLILSPGDGDERSFQLVSRPAAPADEPEWTVHSQGRIVAAAPADDALPPSLGDDPERWAARAHRTVSSDEFYASMRQHEVRLGPSLQAVQAGWVSGEEILCRIAVPEALANADDRLVRAVLLDGCVQVLGGIESYPGHTTRLPVGVRRFRLLNRPTAATLWCYVQVAPAQQSSPGRWSVDAWLFESPTRPIAVFTGLELYDVPRETLLKAFGRRDEDWMFRPAWVPQPQTTNGAPHREPTDDPWLVLADEGGLGDRLAERFRHRGERCVVVRRGDRFEGTGDGPYRADPRRAEHFLRLAEITRGNSAAGYRGIVHLWSLDQHPDGSGLDGLSSSCAAALHMIQALDRAGWTPGLTMCLVTRGAQAVDGCARHVSPWQTPLWGLARTAALEYREMKFLQIDLDPQGNDPPADAILNELLSGAHEPEIALRGPDRYVARLQPYRVDGPITVAIRSDATYLITGGTGGLGLQVASWLVQQGARHLVLASRRGKLPDAAQHTVAQWRDLGVELIIASADVASQPDAARLLADIRRQMSPLAGIVHTAGIRADGTLQSLGWPEFESVLAAKVLGAWNLHQLTESLPLDFFVGFSSIASLLGSPGQANYAAANAFLDGLMHHRRATSRPGVAINWGPWKGAGMLASLDDSHEQALIRRGLIPLEPDTAIRAMAALMHNGVAQAAAAHIDWQQYAATVAGPNSSPQLEAMIASSDPPGDVGGALRSRLQQVVDVARPALLLEYVQQLIADLLGGESAEPVSPDCGFYDLGLDSLSVLMLRNRLQTDLGLTLPATITFKFSTIRALVGHLTESLDMAPAPPIQSAASVAEPAGPPPSTDTLDDLSLSELADRLADKLTAIRSEHDQS